VNSSPKDFLLSELRMVRLVFEKGAGRDVRHMMHLSQVQSFIQASLALHHSPGTNPYHYKMALNKGMTVEKAKEEAQASPIIEIHVHKFDRLEPHAHWWSSPSLEQGDPEAAHIISDYDSERVWARADVLAREQAEQDLD